MPEEKTPKPKMVVEMFQDPRWWLHDRSQNSEPSCVNFLSFRKWRVTAEIIDEPIEVLRERLQELWENNTNHYRQAELEKAAEALGITLEDRMGAKSKRGDHL